MFFHTPVRQLSNKLRFLAIAVHYLSYTSPLGQASHPLCDFLSFLHSHQSIDKKAKVSGHRPAASFLRATVTTPLGQAGHSLAVFPIFFYIPVRQLSEKLKFLAIAVDYLPYTTSLGQAGHPLFEVLCVFYIPNNQLTTRAGGPSPL